MYYYMYRPKLSTVVLGVTKMDRFFLKWQYAFGLGDRNRKSNTWVLLRIEFCVEPMYQIFDLGEKIFFIEIRYQNLFLLYMYSCELFQVIYACRSTTVYTLQLENYRIRDAVETVFIVVLYYRLLEQVCFASADQIYY